MQRRHFHTNAALIAAFVVLATTGCQFFGGSQEYVATVDGEKVPLEDFKERLEQKIALMEGRSSMNAEQFEVLKTGCPERVDRRAGHAESGEEARPLHQTKGSSRDVSKRSGRITEKNILSSISRADRRSIERGKRNCGGGFSWRRSSGRRLTRGYRYRMKKSWTI